MKKSIFLLLTIMMVYFTSCSNSPSDKAKSSIKSYLKENLKNSGSYEPIYFSELDTLKKADTTETKQISIYRLTHIYSITNSDNVKVKMTITFSLDKDLKVTDLNTKSINGDYGTMTGNVYWKYNDYVGNKADAGAEVILITLDTIRGNLKYETNADLDGNYKFEKVLPGRYFLMIRSENVTDCPDAHFSNFSIYETEIKQLFGFELNNYKDELSEINTLDSIWMKTSENFPSNGTLSQMTESLDKTEAISKKRAEKIVELFEKFPIDFKTKIKLYTAYSNAYYFTIIRIEEEKTKNKVTDFGVTCI